MKKNLEHIFKTAELLRNCSRLTSSAEYARGLRDNMLTILIWMHAINSIVQSLVGFYMLTTDIKMYTEINID